jgi:hypothetical protein
MAELARRIDEDFAERISAQPGFVSYEFIDCGGLGEFMTMSVFLTLEQAEASRELARRWAEENREDLEFPRVAASHGEIVVGRAGESMLEETHVGGMRKSVAIRRFAVRNGEVSDLMRRIDELFADRFESMDGFAAWHVFDAGDNEVLWISFVRDLDAAEECDERTYRFMSEDLREFALERHAALSGRLLVSRARVELLQPAHA